MKKFMILVAVLLILALTSMMLREENDNQQSNVQSLTSGINKSHPVLLKGIITIKVKKGVGELDTQKGMVRFNTPSLDAKAEKFEVDLLEKRFHYNPQKLNENLPDLSRIYKIEFPESYPVQKVAREFSKDPNIEYAEPIPQNFHCEIPDDPFYSSMNHLPQIKADSAWDIHKGEDGTEEVIIAIVDDGVDWDHEDLVDNIWQNMGEDADGDGQTLEFINDEWVLDPDDANNIDDDNNGYTDDLIGWNFYLSANDPDHIPGQEHGTHCAGLAGATTNNNIGVASISWNLTILPVQASDIGGGIIHGYNGIIYAAENGADVISNSWSSIFYAQASHEAITYAIGLGSIIVAAASNDNLFENHYPADIPGVISVAAVSSNDHKASFSNFGPNVWISAPGSPVYSTTINDTYQYWSGTSMATPLTASLLGLVKSYHPDWNSDQVITQVLGTAYDIDPINPAYANQLGSGRIDAFLALTESNATLEQEISLDLVHTECYDTDGNNILEPGDTVSMSFQLRNYDFGVGSENATFTLTTQDPDIVVLNNSSTGTIPADNFFNLENVFEFKIDDDAVFHPVNFKLVTTADVEITWGDTISFEVVVAPEGVLVYQSEGTGNAFSGEYIHEYLIEQGLQSFYTTHFPSSLNGFDAVFLSYGNYGQYLEDGGIITMEMKTTMEDYLVNGGYLYVDCGSPFGIMTYLEYPNVDDIMELFGIAESEAPLGQNTINLLNGLSGSICEDLTFGGTTQSSNWYIEIMTPNENGVAALEEEDYGTVAVQGEGEFGQKTFCFSYALGRLTDGDEGSKEELLTKIAEYFNLITTGENELTTENLGSDLRIIPNPSSGVVHLRIMNIEHGYVICDLYTIAGIKTKKLLNKEMMAGTYEMEIDLRDLPAGVYYIVLRTINGTHTAKLIKL